ncbi:unnamed protein product [Trichogramma brassicae]|uniref:Uncharacterized protein n=1 Tax=Trichogramma brassicae TaxID=86971 RepID=A0A6H5IHS0_9HYME|nr:unnamed protein product [Trichogramma brassicae]
MVSSHSRRGRTQHWRGHLVTEEYGSFTVECAISYGYEAEQPQRRNHIIYVYIRRVLKSTMALLKWKKKFTPKMPLPEVRARIYTSFESEESEESEETEESEESEVNIS